MKGSVYERASDGGMYMSLGFRKWAAIGVQLSKIRVQDKARVRNTSTL